MKYRLFLLVLLLASAAFIPSLVFASSRIDARMINRESTLYDYLDELYALTGKAKPNTNRPWTENQAREYLELVDYGELSEGGRKIYSSAEKLINEGLRWNYSKGFGLSAGIIFTPEAYFHTDSSFDTEDKWVRSWNDRKPFMRLWFEASSNSSFYTSADILYRYGRATTEDDYGLLKDIATADGYVGSYKITESGLPYVMKSAYFSDKAATNVYTNTLNFSFIWPHRAIFSAGGNGWNISFSRDRLRIGNSHIGSLLVSDHTDYNDYIRTTFYNPLFTYDWILLGINPLVSSSELQTEEGRLYMIHTLDFRILDKVSLKLSENILWKYKVFDLQFLNPAFFFHNLNNRGMFNALAYIEVNASIMKGLSVYGQYAMDQARALNEGTNQSDASGFSLGFEYSFEALDGVFEFYGEYLSTSPLLYRRDGVDFIKASRYYHMEAKTPGVSNGHIPFFEYIGYRYGGDTRTFKTGLSYRASEWGRIEGYVQLMEHGAMSIYSSHSIDGKNEGDANIPDKTPSGDISTRAVILSLRGECSLEGLLRWPGISAEAEIDWIYRSDYEKKTRTYSGQSNDLQVSLGISLAI